MLIADASGKIKGRFTVPPDISAGDKKVLFLGSGGTLGESIYSAQGTLTRRNYQVETTINETRWQSPPPASNNSTTVTIDNSTAPGNVPPASNKLNQYEVMYESFEYWLRAQQRYSIFRDACELYLTRARAAIAAQDWSGAQNQIREGIRIVYLDGIAAGVWAQSVGNQIDQIINELTQRWSYTKGAIDPLAQTFTLSVSRQVVGCDLWFTACGGPVRVDLRSVTAGVPDAGILATATVAPDAINVGGETRVTFAAPASLSADAEYALVVMANDSTTALAVAELGKWDPVSAHWVTEQPYTVGVLLSSSNTSTWTPHQDRDMAFRLLGARIEHQQRDIALGTVAVDNVTDLMLMSYADRPDSSTRCDYRLTLPDGTSLAVADGQAIRLAAAITGDVEVTATLHGSATASPVLHPDTQVAYGHVAPAADYITRAIPAGPASRLRVIFDAYIPAGAGVAVSACGIEPGDAWQAVPYDRSTPGDDGWAELVHELASIDAASVRVKLALSGSSSARPRVRNLRVIVT